MLKIYTGHNRSSKKAVEWLNENDIDFIEIQLRSGILTKKELKLLLSSTDNGLDDLLKRATKVNFEDLILNQALDILIADPSHLKSPILFEGNNLIFGFNDDEIRCFIPCGTRRAKNYLM